jgi:membrane protease YdiL (CAAX protease family)
MKFCDSKNSDIVIIFIIYLFAFLSFIFGSLPDINIYVKQLLLFSFVGAVLLFYIYLKQDDNFTKRKYLYGLLIIGALGAIDLITENIKGVGEGKYIFLRYILLLVLNLIVFLPIFYLHKARKTSLRKNTIETIMLLLMVLFGLYAGFVVKINNDIIINSGIIKYVLFLPLWFFIIDDNCTHLFEIKKWSRKNKIFVIIFLLSIIFIQLNRLRMPDSPSDLFLNIGYIVILQVLPEEIFYRGIFQNKILKILNKYSWGAFIAIMSTAIIFTIAHCFVSVKDIYGILILGIFLGWSYYKSGNLFYPMATHLIYNILIVYIKGS